MARPDICVIDSPTYGFVYFTVTQRYTISRSATVTDFKIESGEKVTDHQVADNKRFAFSGIVTTAEVLGGGYSETVDPSTIFTKLDELIGTGELFKFTSDSELGFSEVEDCVLVSYDINRDETMEDGVEVSVDVRQIQFVESVKRTSAQQPRQDKIDQVAAESDKGTQDTKQTELEDELEENLRVQAGFGD